MISPDLPVLQPFVVDGTGTAAAFAVEPTAYLVGIAAALHDARPPGSSRQS
jgi:hypothetical protein